MNDDEKHIQKVNELQPTIKKIYDAWVNGDYEEAENQAGAIVECDGIKNVVAMAVEIMILKDCLVSCENDLSHSKKKFDSVVTPPEVQVEGDK